MVLRAAGRVLGVRSGCQKYNQNDFEKWSKISVVPNFGTNAKCTVVPIIGNYGILRFIY